MTYDTVELPLNKPNKSIPANVTWREAIAPYIREGDDLALINHCLSKRQWTDKQALFMHSLACRSYETQAA